jgi:hypothetical protein
VGTLLSGPGEDAAAPSGAGGGEEGFANRSSSAAAEAAPRAAPSYLNHLPTGGSAAAAGGGGRGHTGTWTSSLAAEAEIQEEEIPGAVGTAAAAGAVSSEGGALAGFDLLRHARSGREVVALFASMCLATLRLRELVDALLLLGGNDPQRVPYPSLQPWAARSDGRGSGSNSGSGGAAISKKWQQHSTASAHLPWARFGETAAEVVLDSYLAIREQFPAPAAAVRAGARAGGRRKGECSVEERLAVLGRVSVELRDYESLLALGTFLRDERTVAAALRRGKLWPQEYRAIFLDERMEAGGPAIKAFVDRCTAVVVPAPAAVASAREGGAPV